MNEYRYFIADDNKTGTLICSNEIKGKDMLLLVGHIIYLYNAASVDDIVDKLVTMYGFSVMKEHITALDLNTAISELERMTLIAALILIRLIHTMTLSMRVAIVKVMDICTPILTE